MPEAPVYDMNCEWVERHLSAFHDDALDADTTARIQSHVATCDRCETVLNDYVRFDRLVAELPRVAPADKLRERIFASAEFRAILQGEDGASSEKPAEPDETPKRAPTRLIRQITQVAAAVVFLVGIGYALKTLAASPAHSTNASFVACPHIAPGPRIVYRNGQTQTLFSGAARLVCDKHIAVGAIWQVSPDGHWIAYTDATSGRLRLVGSNASGDHIIDTGVGTVAALAWAPDSQRFVVVKSEIGTAYHVLIAKVGDTTAVEYTVFQAQRLTDGPIWSPDSQSVALAFARVQPNSTDAKATGLAVVNISSHRFTDFLADVGNVLGMSLLNRPQQSAQSAGSPTNLTIITGHDGGATEMDLYGFDTSGGKLAHVVPTNSVMAANFSSATGQWALAQNDGTIIALNAVTGAQTPLAHIGGVTRLSWSPSGKYLAATSGTTLWLITPTGATRLTTTLGSAMPIWGADDSHLAFAANNDALIANATTGQITTSASNPEGSIKSFIWGPSNTLAIWSSQGVALENATIGAGIAEAPQWSISA